MTYRGILYHLHDGRHIVQEVGNAQEEIEERNAADLEVHSTGTLVASWEPCWTSDPDKKKWLTRHYRRD